MPNSSNPEKIMLFLLPLITLALFMAAIVIFGVMENWKYFANLLGLM